MNVGLPSWVPMATLILVCVAIAAFFVTGGLERGDSARAVSDSRVGRDDSAAGPRPATADKPGEGPTDERTDSRRRQPERVTPAAYVEVYNNSTVSGLAAQTAAELQDAGWQVVGTDNWFGNIPTTTVYFPDRLQRQAELLARDLGVTRVLPAVSPMRFDRLTVILTDAA